MENKQLYKIYFHGSLATTYGAEEKEVYGANIQDAFAWLSARYGQEFKDMIVNNDWHITSGPRTTEELSEADNFIDETVVGMPVEDTELHVFPVIQGSGSTGRIIAGVVLIIVAVLLYWNPLGWYAGAVGGTMFGVSAATALTVGVAGASMLAQGIIEATSAQPSMDDYGSASGPDPKASFLFNGVVNNTEQGVPVPLVYGLHLTGSTVISAGVDVEQLLDGAAYN